MTTEEMKALPTGAYVRSIKTRELYRKQEEDPKDRGYRSPFRRVGLRGPSSNVTKFHGKRIILAS